MIDRETVQRIKDTADIVEVVSDYVSLTRRGSNYMGLCPFHNERTPSFSVNRRKNFCYCFSCHKGGSPVNFIMEKEGISYHDALLQLAAKYGIEVHERELSDEEQQRRNRRDGMFTANEWSMRYFEKNLRDTEEGRNVGLQYFYGRGLTDAAIKAFHLGYAIDRGNAMAEASRQAGYAPEIMRELGLLGLSQQGERLYDRFRGRVIFPVFTSSGKVVAFGGRTLKGDKAKYINSPESEIYSKSNELYGLFQAKNSIVRNDKCFLVEGYMDVIGMWQSGMENVLASSGTALTDGQIALIHRFTSNVTLLYDGDNAGIHAALRGIDMLLAHRLNVKVLLLPDGHDPDSFARAHTPEEFRRYVEENETDIIRFKTRVLMEQSGGDPQARSNAIHSIVQSLACIPDDITRNVYINECSTQLGIDREIIASAVLKALETAVQNECKRREYQRYSSQQQQQPDTTQASRQQNVPSARQPQQGTAPQQQCDAPQQQPKPVRLSPAELRLRKCERQVLQYCVKYGLVDFCDEVDGDGNTVYLSVCEFVEHELRLDGIEFSDPAYAKLFGKVMTLKDDHAQELQRRVTEIERQAEGWRQEKTAEIAQAVGTMQQLRQLEEKADEEVAARKNEALTELYTSFPGRILASHEDDEVRRITTELITERYILSRVYTRAGAHIPSEYERLYELLPRAVLEWKESVLELRMNAVRKELVQAQAQGDSAKTEALQKQIFDLMETRSMLAREIGERIVSSGK